MSNYPPKTWQNGVDPANATNLNHLEQGVAAIPGLYTIPSTALVSNVNINSGVTNNYTATGLSYTGGTIPSGTKAIMYAYYYTSAATNTLVGFTPHGTTWTSGNYPASNPVATASAIGNAGWGIVPLDSNGKIDISVFNGNITGLYVNVYGYIV